MNIAFISTFSLIFLINGDLFGLWSKLNKRIHWELEIPFFGTCGRPESLCLVLMLRASKMIPIIQLIIFGSSSYCKPILCQRGELIKMDTVQ